MISTTCRGLRSWRRRAPVLRKENQPKNKSPWFSMKSIVSNLTCKKFGFLNVARDNKSKDVRDFDDLYSNKSKNNIHS